MDNDLYCAKLPKCKAKKEIITGSVANQRFLNSKTVTVNRYLRGYYYVRHRTSIPVVSTDPGAANKHSIYFLEVPS